MKIEISRSCLEAAATCSAPTTDTRYYLHNVLVEMRTGLAIATDGHLLFVGKAFDPLDIEDPDSLPDQLFIPAEEIANAGKVAKKGRNTPVSFDLERLDSDRWLLGKLQFDAPQDLRYPEWRKVCPLTVSGEVAQFDIDLLAKAKKALVQFSGEKELTPSLSHNGNGAAVMTYSGAKAMVVVMPMRIEPDIGHVASLIGADVSGEESQDQAA